MNTNTLKSAMPYEQTIILIGPMGTGKSTIGTCLAEKLGLEYHPLDELHWKYYEEIGFDNDQAKQIIQSDKGFNGFLAYMKPFEAYAVERFMADYQTGILDFGAGHVVHRDEKLFERVENALAPHQNVILLLPSPDLDESVAILNERILKRIEALGTGYAWAVEENKHFVHHPSSHKLAKTTIYTKGKTPQETCQEIIQMLEKPGN